MVQNMPKKSRVAICPACDHTIQISNTIRLNQFVVCQECYSELEVIDLNPLTLDWAFDIEDTEDNPYSEYGNGYYDDEY